MQYLAGPMEFGPGAGFIGAILIFGPFVFTVGLIGYLIWRIETDPGKLKRPQKLLIYVLLIVAGATVISINYFGFPIKI